jgi:hypothetical protein
MAWRNAVASLLAQVLPHCTYHSDRIATHEHWRFHYCDACAARHRETAPDIIELNYAQSVRDLIDAQ